MPGNKKGSFKKEANPFMKFIKASSSHLTGAVGEIISEYTPNTTSIFEDAKEFLTESKKSAKETSGNLLNKVKETFRLQTFRNIFNWYTTTGDSFGFSIEDDDMSDLSFDIEDNSASTSSFKSEEKKQAKTTLSEMNRNSDKVASSVVESSKKLAEIQVASLSSMTNMLEKTNSLISAGFEKVNSSLRDLIKVVTENTNSIIKVVSIGKEADSNNSSYSSSNNNNNFDYKKLISGNFSFKDYFKSLGTKKAADAIDPTGMLGMVELSDLKMFYDSIKEGGGKALVSLVLGQVIEGMFPALKKTITNFDTGLKTMFQNTVRDLGRGFIFGQKLPDNFFGGLLKQLGVSPEYYSFKNIQKSGFEHKTISFDTETKESIVKVIPSYLREILKALTKEDKYYDLKAGYLRTSSQINETFQNQKNALMYGKDASQYAYDMKNVLIEKNYQAIENDAQIQFILNQFFRRLYIRINKAEDVKDILNEYGTVKESILKKLKEEINYDKLPEEAKKVFIEHGDIIANFISLLGTDSKRTAKIQQNAYNYLDQYNNLMEEHSKFYKNQDMLNVLKANDSDEELYKYQVGARKLSALQSYYSRTKNEKSEQIKKLEEELSPKNSFKKLGGAIGKIFNTPKEAEEAEKKSQAEIKSIIDQKKADLEKLQKEVEEIDSKMSEMTVDAVNKGFYDVIDTQTNQSPAPTTPSTSQSTETTPSVSLRRRYSRDRRPTITPSLPSPLTPTAITESQNQEIVPSYISNSIRPTSRPITNVATSGKRKRRKITLKGLAHAGYTGRINTSFMGAGELQGAMQMLKYLFRGGDEVEEDDEQSLEPPANVSQQAEQGALPQNSANSQNPQAVVGSTTSRRGTRLYSSIIPIPPTFWENLFPDKNAVQQGANQATKQATTSLRDLLLQTNQPKNPKEKNNNDPSLLDRILTGAMGAVGGGILGGPFGLLIGTVLGSSYPVAKMGQKVNDFLFGDLFNQQKDPKKPKMGFIEEQLFNFFIPFKLEFKKTKDFFMAHFKRSIIGEFNAILAGIKSVIANGIKKSWLGKAWKWIADSPLGKLVGGIFKFPFKVIGWITKGLWTLVTKGIPGLLGGAARSIIGLGSAGARMAGGVAAGLGGMIGGENFKKGYKEYKKGVTDQFNEDIGKSGYHATDAMFELLQGNTGYAGQMFKNPDKINWALFGSKQDREYIAQEKQKWIENRNRLRSVFFGGSVGPNGQTPLDQTASNTADIASQLNDIRTALGIGDNKTKTAPSKDVQAETAEQINTIRSNLGLSTTTVANTSGSESTKRGIRLYSSMGVPIPDGASWFKPKEKVAAEETGDITKQAIIDTMDSARDEVNSGEISKEQASTTLNRVASSIRDPKTQADAKAASKVTLLSMVNARRKPTESEKKKSLFESIFEFLTKSLILPSWLKTAGIILATLPAIGLGVSAMSSLLKNLYPSKMTVQEYQNEKMKRDKMMGDVTQKTAAHWTRTSIMELQAKVLKRNIRNRINAEIEAAKIEGRPLENVVDRMQSAMNNEFKENKNEFKNEMDDILTKDEAYGKNYQIYKNQGSALKANQEKLKGLETTNEGYKKRLRELDQRKWQIEKELEGFNKNTHGYNTRVNQLNQIKGEMSDIKSLMSKTGEEMTKLTTESASNATLLAQAKQMKPNEALNAISEAKAKAVHQIKVASSWAFGALLIGQLLKVILLSKYEGRNLSEEELAEKNYVENLIDTATAGSTVIIHGKVILNLPKLLWESLVEFWNKSLEKLGTGESLISKIVNNFKANNAADLAEKMKQAKKINLAEQLKKLIDSGKKFLKGLKTATAEGISKFFQNAVERLSARSLVSSLSKNWLAVATVTLSGIYGAIDWPACFGFTDELDFKIDQGEVVLMGAISSCLNIAEWNSLTYLVIEFIMDLVIKISTLGKGWEIKYTVKGKQEKLAYGATSFRMWLAWTLYMLFTLLDSDRSAVRVASESFNIYTEATKNLPNAPDWDTYVGYHSKAYKATHSNVQDIIANKGALADVTAQKKSIFDKESIMVDAKTGKIYTAVRQGQTSYDRGVSNTVAQNQGYIRDTYGNMKIFGKRTYNKDGTFSVEDASIRLNPFEPKFGFDYSTNDPEIDKYFRRYNDLLSAFLSAYYKTDPKKASEFMKDLLSKNKEWYTHLANSYLMTYPMLKLIGHDWDKTLHDFTPALDQFGNPIPGFFRGDKNTYDVLRVLKHDINNKYWQGGNQEKYPSEILAKYLDDKFFKKYKDVNISFYGKPLNSIINNLKADEEKLFRKKFLDNNVLSDMTIKDYNEKKEKGGKEKAEWNREQVKSKRMTSPDARSLSMFGGANDYNPTERINASNAFFHKSKSNGVFSDNWDPWGINESKKSIEALDKTFLSEHDIKRFYKYKTPIMVPLDERLQYSEAYKLYTYNYYNNKSKGNATVARMLMQADQAADPFGSSFTSDSVIGASMKDTMKEINNISFKNPLSDKKKNGFYASPLGDYPLTITSKFGPRKLNGADDMHTGIDLGAPGGTKITAPSNGIVVDNAPTEASAGYGNFLAYLDESGKMFMGFAHMREPSPLQIGSKVTKGQTIGLVGNTGHSFGDHLHFEVVKRPDEKASKNYWANWGGKGNLNTFYDPEDIINNRDLNATYNYDYESGNGSVSNEDLKNGEEQKSGFVSMFDNSPLGKLFGLFGKFFGGVASFGSKKGKSGGTSSAGAGNFTPEEAKNNRDRIYMILRNKGFSPEAATGIVANIQAESAFSTTVISYDGYGSVGLCQWTDDRKTNLMNFAQQKGMPYDSVDLQVEFLLHELNNYPSIMALKNTNDAELMAEEFCRKFERPAKVNLRVSERREMARKLLPTMMALEKQAQAIGSSEKTVQEAQAIVESKSDSNKKGGPLSINPRLMRSIRSGAKLANSEKAFNRILAAPSKTNNYISYSNNLLAKGLRSNPDRIVRMKPSRIDLNRYGFEDDEIEQIFQQNIDLFDSWVESDWKKAGFNPIQVKYMRNNFSTKSKPKLVKATKKTPNKVFNRKPQIPQVKRTSDQIHIPNPSEIVQQYQAEPIETVENVSIPNSSSIEQKLDTLIMLLTKLLQSSEKGNSIGNSNIEMLGTVFNLNKNETNKFIKKVNQNYIPNRYSTQTNPHGIPQIIIG